jgi:hypothetical protein
VHGVTIKIKTWFILFDTLLSPQRPFHVGFVADNVAMAQVFFRAVNLSLSIYFNSWGLG